ncbi:unnamed protein product [Blepharisma stoltei]|uniref:Uncharacterized protein n=1 Tax=Blepharisma stoltei TaxID=1481888 RepID=A0AAU9JW51_9CILI|nr:unnamed protein product [Blepharisma stoltei]
MEDRDAKIENYLNTIDAMGEQMEHLKSKLSEINSRISSKASQPNLKLLDSKINQSQNALQQMLQEIEYERSIFRRLTVSNEPANPSFSSVDKNLIKRFEELSEENKILASKKKSLEYSNLRIPSESSKTLNPNVQFLMKKAIQVENQNQNYLDLIVRLEEERTSINSAYSKITQSLNSVDKMKQKLKELEDFIENKNIIISKLEEKLKEKNQELKEKEFEIENSEEQIMKESVKNLRVELDETIGNRKLLEEEIKKIENESSQQKLRTTVLSSKEANYLCKEEVKRLEADIIEKNKILIQSDKTILKLKSELQEILKKPRKSVSRFSLQPSSHASTPLLSEPKMPSSPTSPKTPQTFAARADPRRNTIISKISKEGMTRDLRKTFRTIGKPNQSLGSKIVELNRGLFLSRINSTPTLFKSKIS